MLRVPRRPAFLLAVGACAAACRTLTAVSIDPAEEEVGTPVDAHAIDAPDDANAANVSDGDADGSSPSDAGATDGDADAADPASGDAACEPQGSTCGPNPMCCPPLLGFRYDADAGCIVTTGTALYCNQKNRDGFCINYGQTVGCLERNGEVYLLTESGGNNCAPETYNTVVFFTPMCPK